jgi:hypothetical protein
LGLINIGQRFQGGIVAYILIRYILNSNKKQEENLANLQQQILDLYKKSIENKKDEKDITSDKLERFAETARVLATKVPVVDTKLPTDNDAELTDPPIVIEDPRTPCWITKGPGTSEKPVLLCTSIVEACNEPVT